jgi:hypothetical protein
LLVALAAGLIAALAWAVLRSVLDITIGSLVVAAVGGWAIGSSLRRAGSGVLPTLVLAVAAWLFGLLLAWLVAMAILPESTRSLAERLAATPFLEWLVPQVGIVEVGALVTWVVAAVLAVRRPRTGSA